jgi:hypothetical protein
VGGFEGNLFSPVELRDPKHWERARRANALLRKLGMLPAEVSRSESLDTLKYAAHRVLNRVQRVRQKLARPAGD